jgi:hypothetical protein
MEGIAGPRAVQVSRGPIGLGDLIRAAAAMPDKDPAEIAYVLGLGPKPDKKQESDPPKDSKK